MNDNDDDSIVWFWPGNYPTRCNNTFCEDVALDVLNGASLSAAAMKRGVAPSRVKEWMRWGEDAYRRDANETDPHADYLNLFLKIMQAAGISGVNVQQYLHHHDPRFWLSHHPEHRIEWGDRTTLDAANPQALLLGTSNVVEVDAEVVEMEQLAPLSTPDMRDALKTLIASAPAALPSAAPVVDADASDRPSGDRREQAG